jgi:hypothetical protein
MSVVKIQNIDRLDRLIAKITLRIGRKPTQQEVVDICINIGEKNFELLIAELFSVPIIDNEKLKKIKQISEDLKNVPWDVKI